MKVNKRDITFYAVIGGLFALDVVSTMMILNRGGRELNPLMSSVVLTPSVHIATKGILSVMIMIVGKIAGRYVPDADIALYVAIIIMYTVVLLNNVTVLLSMVI